MMPLYGFLEGDTIGLLILAEASDTVDALGQKLQQAANVRVAPRPRVRVLYKNATLDPLATLASVGIGALDRFDVVGCEEP